MLVDDPAGLTPPNTVIKETVGGNPNLNAEVAYEWTYGVVWTPAKLIKGLTLSADFYHIDLRNVISGREPNIILANNFGSSTGTLPNGAPTGGIFSDLIQRDPVTGAVLNVNSRPLEPGPVYHRRPRLRGFLSTGYLDLWPRQPRNIHVHLQWQLPGSVCSGSRARRTTELIFSAGAS